MLGAGAVPRQRGFVRTAVKRPWNSGLGKREPWTIGSKISRHESLRLAEARDAHGPEILLEKARAAFALAGFAAAGGAGFPQRVRDRPGGRGLLGLAVQN